MSDHTSQNQHGKLKLALFVDSSLLSCVVLKQVRNLKQECKISDEQIDVYYVDEDIEKFIEMSVLICPTLIRLDVDPPQRLVGELRNKAMLMALIGLGGMPSF